MNTEIFYLLLPDSWDSFRGNLPRNIKESLRKCYNSLAREELEFHLRVVSSAEEAPEALNVFFRLHAQRAARAGYGAPSRHFCPRAGPRFPALLLRRHGEGGKSAYFPAVIAEQVVATRIGFLLGRRGLHVFFWLRPCLGAFQRHDHGRCRSNQMGN